MSTNLPPDLIEAVCEGVFDLAGERDETVTGGRPVWDEVTNLVLDVLAEKAQLIPLAEVGAQPAEDAALTEALKAVAAGTRAIIRCGDKIAEQRKRAEDAEAKLAEVRKFCTDDPRTAGSLVAADILGILNRPLPGVPA